ncbi:transposase [Chryseobacterium oncorhynchi]|uniref:Transposase n=2 Tax=Chryseobacterium oncorhynchi TaxID=741074 RepID=A0A316WW14_9FLAO|nr:transposase [Chryseobacterium oncorhynchi]
MDEKRIMKNISPDYRQIYTDIIDEVYPEKKGNMQINNKMECIETVMDILTLNTLIFGSSEQITESKSRKLRSYDQNSILKILEYQRKNKLNNITTAIHFKISRNTLTKWHRIFKDKF